MTMFTCEAHGKEFAFPCLLLLSENQIRVVFMWELFFHGVITQKSRMGTNRANNRLGLGSEPVLGYGPGPNSDCRA